MKRSLTKSASMQTILVVDDEAIQRRVLAKIIREARPSCEVLEARNGEAALEVVRTKSVDVVFTDIKMPIMDGLDFIEHMNHFNRDVKVILLSGYRYFEYAQKAIRLGAFDYLLKPLKEESICQILDKVEDSLQKQKTDTLENEEIKRRLDSTLSVYYERLLYDWVTNGIAEEKFNEIRQQFALGTTGMVLVSQFDKENLLLESVKSMEQIKSSMFCQMEGCLRPVGPSVSFFSAEDRRLMVTVLTVEHPNPDVSETVASLMDAFSRHLSDPYGITLTVGIGSECADLFHEAPSSYKEAVKAAASGYFLNTDKVILYTEISKLIRPMPYDFLKDEEQLKESVRKMNRDLIVKNVDGLFATILENGLPEPEPWNKSFLHLVYRVAPVIRDFVSDQDYKEILVENEKRLTLCSNSLQFKSELLNILWQFVNILQNNRSKKHETIMEACIHYIDLHYMEDLSLDMVSNQLFFSPNYLSMIFKNHLGMTFTKYLSDVRIKKAVELLESTDRKVYQIASDVGFKDDKYFYRVFKSRFGLTPDEYRRNIYMNKHQ